jgi:hypothetical protein
MQYTENEFFTFVMFTVSTLHFLEYEVIMTAKTGKYFPAEDWY